MVNLDCNPGWGARAWLGVCGAVGYSASGVGGGGVATALAVVVVVVVVVVLMVSWWWRFGGGGGGGGSGKGSGDRGGGGEIVVATVAGAVTTAALALHGAALHGCATLSTTSRELTGSVAADQPITDVGVDAPVRVTEVIRGVQSIESPPSPSYAHP